MLEGGTGVKRRNIVLLLDGTGQEFCSHNSNLVKLMSVLQADEEQYIYYTSGLGELSGSRLAKQQEQFCQTVPARGPGQGSRRPR